MPLKTVSEKERRAIFTQVASEIGIRPDMIEKDYWVSWVLNRIFEHEKLKKILLFKGGTSLSKAFLADESYFFCELERIMDGAEQCGCHTLATTTWLNSNPRFLALFPGEWTDNLGEPSEELQNNLGFHGQFVMADGSLNLKAADYFLEHGKLKYRPRASYCSFANVRQHIRERRNANG